MKRKTPFLIVNKKRIILFVCLLIACLQLMFFMFNLSAMTSKESAKASDGIVNDVTEIVATQKGVEAENLSDELSDFINAVVRKTGHFLLFSLLGMLTYLLSASVVLKEKKYWLPSVFSLPVCTLFAISDEIHQTFVKGRHGRAGDVLVDAAGAVIGTLAAVVLIVLYRKTKKYINSKKERINEKTV